MLDSAAEAREKISQGDLSSRLTVAWGLDLPAVLGLGVISLEKTVLGKPNTNANLF